MVLRGHRYRIVMAGDWNDVACEAFDGWKIEPVDAEIALIGDMDQAALHGVLVRIDRLGFTLVEVRRLPAAWSAAAS
jgi:hypothetical protein